MINDLCPASWEPSAAPQNGVLIDHVVWGRTVITAAAGKVSFPLKPTGVYQMSPEMFRLRIIAQIFLETRKAGEDEENEEDD